MKKILLIDGNSIVYRAYYGMPALSNKDGVPTGAIAGFFNIIQKIINDENPTHLAIAFDKGKKTFRHSFDENYKGTRKKTPLDLIEQINILKDILKSLKITYIEKDLYEADDLLYSMALKAKSLNYESVILTSDRDLLQVVSDNIYVKHISKEVIKYDEKKVYEKFLIYPKNFVDFKGLAGDSSDNIKGVAGIGEKSAIALIEKYGTIENIYENLEDVEKKYREKLRNNKDEAFLSKKLATIVETDIDIDIENCLYNIKLTEESIDILQKLQLNKVISMFEKEELIDIKKDTLDLSYKEITIDDIDLLDERVYVTFLVDKVVLKNKNDIFLIKENANSEKFDVKLTNDKKIATKENNDYLNKFNNIELIKSSINYKLEVLKKIYNNTKEICFVNLKEELHKLFYISNFDLYDFVKEKYNELYEFINDKTKLQCMYLVEFLNYSNIKIDDDKFLEDKAENYTFLELAILKMNKLEEVFVERYNELIDKDLLSLYQNIELETVYVLFDMELQGILIDKEKLEDFGKYLDSEIEKEQSIIYELADCEFNINSPKQIGEILFEKLELKHGGKTKTGYKTDVETLEKLRYNHIIIDHILNYRSYTKLKSTYVTGLLTCIQSDNRIHPTFNQFVASTGRLSCENPNLQNIPIRTELGRKIRECFISKENTVFIDADYSQIELRVMAHLSGDFEMLEAYKNGEDIHKLTASHIFNVSLDEVIKDLRQKAKAVNFGIIYGISAFGLGKDVGITKKEAGEYIDKYFEKYPRIKEYLDELVKKAKEDGYVETLYKRRRYIPEINEKNFMRKSFGERIAMNSPIQGTAADIMKIAMINVFKKLIPLKSKILLQIHDELLIETYEDEVEIVEKIVNEEMKNAVKLNIPLTVSIERKENWE